MRTALTIDDAVLARAQALAKVRKVSTGKALSDLARRGQQAALGTRRVGWFAVFAVPGGTPAIDPDAVREAEVAEDEARAGVLVTFDTGLAAIVGDDCRDALECVEP